MKKLLASLTLLLPILVFNLNAQSWQAQMDSTKFYQEMNDFQTALKWAEKSEQAAKAQFGEKDTNYIFSLSQIYICYLNLGKTEKAIEYGEKTKLLIKEVRGDHNPEYADILGNLGEFYKIIGNYDKAKSLLIEALEMKRQLFKSDNPDLAGAIESLARFYNAMGRYAEAEPLYKESLEMFRRLFKGDNKDLAMSINNMAYFFNGRGRYAEAEPLYKESLEMRRRLFKDDQSDLAMSINNMASFYNGRGWYKEAEPLYKEALGMYRRLLKGDHPDLEKSINNMAWFYDGRRRYAEAEPLYKEALEMSRRLFKRDHPDLAKSINNMAMFYNGRERYDEAEPLYREALEMYRHVFKGDHPSLAGCINSLAMFYNGRKRYDEAEPLYKESLEMRRRLFKGDHPDLARSINNLALFYNNRENFILAEPLYKESLEVYKNMLNNYFPSLSEIEKQLFWNTVSNNFESFNSFAVNRSTENPAITSNMFDMQLYTKALLFNSTAKIKKRIMNSGDSILIEKYRELSDKKELLVKLYTMTEAARKKRNFNVDSIEQSANNLEKEISLKSELYSQSYEKKKVTWKTVQAVLKPDEAAVEVIRFRYKEKNRFTDTIYYAFLIISDLTEDHPDIVVLENGKLLEKDYYKNYRSMIKYKTTDTTSFRNYWGKIYDKTKKFKKIYFSADGIYNKVNPATLLMPDGKYMLDIQDIQQVNSTKDLLIGYYKSQQESNIYNSAMLIGNPNFSLSESELREANYKFRGKTDDDNNYEKIVSTRGIELTNLPGTEIEINDIEKFLKGRNWIVNSYLGDMALKTAVKSANSPRVLHIATHGMFLEDINSENKETLGFETKKVIENPLLRSGLFFTGADNYLRSDTDKTIGDENGLLTAYEAMNLDLDKTELVVLSACETGLGEVKNGEGVFGLRRAFQQAGAKAVIMSLWAVNDEATQKLMSSFYKNWVTGMSKREAFSKAQEVVRTLFPEPYYWGAFVMVGE